MWTLGSITGPYIFQFALWKFTISGVVWNGKLGTQEVINQAYGIKSNHDVFKNPLHAQKTGTYRDLKILKWLEVAKTPGYGDPILWFPIKKSYQQLGNGWEPEKRPRIAGIYGCSSQIGMTYCCNVKCFRQEPICQRKQLNMKALPLQFRSLDSISCWWCSPDSNLNKWHNGLCAVI